MANYLTLKEPGSILGGWSPNSVKERSDGEECEQCGEFREVEVCGDA
jgi:hypothetical protein